MNRRSFIKTAVAAGATVAAVPFVTPIAPTAAQAMGVPKVITIYGFDLAPDFRTMAAINRMRRDGFSIRIQKPPAERSMYRAAVCQIHLGREWA